MTKAWKLPRVYTFFTGLTAGQVCFCSKVKKQLPTKLQSALERNKSYSTLKPGLQDKDSIFKLASNPKSFYELQKKLQVSQKFPVFRASDFFQDWLAEVTHGARNGGPKHIKLTTNDIWVVHFTYTLTQTLVCTCTLTADDTIKT